MNVSDRDRRAMERQAVTLAENDNTDEGDAVLREALVVAANRERAARDMAPLEPWWSTKTETKLHERARALGLLDRVR